ncbi:hypothetical protein HZI73_23655 [Vallitalea pronyensis]|uniref:receptor protein-tyrosine kinase n=2 Tax=Vallitalea pronyensis TaxID=1348613 RepID=A0A8J8MPZ1_9FIRM|nr:hypothetical protein HZI73_23655 [Vallitalea pronyensis]
MVVSLDSSLDQRSAGSLVGGNLQSDTKEYVTELKNVHPHQNFLFNGNAEQLCNSGHILNWKGEVDNPTDVAFLRRTSSDWKISGSGSFEIRVPAKSNRIAKYVCTTVGEAGTHYHFSGKIGAHRTEGYFTIEALNANGKAIKTWQTPKHKSSQVIEQSLCFTAPNDTVQLRVSIVNGLSHNTTTVAEHIFADDLVLTKEHGDTSPWVPIKYSAYEEITQNNPGYVEPHTISNPEYVPAVNEPGTTQNFSYTGNRQTFTAPYTGEYTLEAWGAAGGNYSKANGGYGTYVKTTKTLNKGDTMYVYVGGQGKPGNSKSGGWNGGGTSGGCTCGSSSGGGATDFRTTTSTNSRFLVAGGGGGAGTSGNHGRSSIYATMSSYVGQTGATSDGGGGGGGYRGGYNGGTDMGAYAGSSFVNNTEITHNVSNSTYVVTTGSNSGHGRARVTLPPKYSPEVGEPTILVNNAYYVPAVVKKTGSSIVVITPAQGEPYIPDLAPTIRTVIQSDKTISEPPDDWYETKVITIPANPTVTVPGGGNFSAGNFLLLDYPFQVYFPNEGDFYGTGAYGLSKTSNHTGKGFTNNMSTTEWTAEKFAKFGFAVIHKGVLYPANTEISLTPIDENYYDFYLPLGNKEALSAFTEFYAVANNAPSVDNRTAYNNKKRHSHKNARHSALREYNIDIIGRIGNLVMEDTGDYRFSNFFKQPLYNEWYIPSVVHKVALDQQRAYLGPLKDIRNHTVSTHTHYLNTYGSLDFLNRAPVNLPLSPSINNIPALQRQPLRYGYPIFMDIQTTGNYYSKMQIIPYYYHLNLKTGTLTPVDVYIKEDKEYKPINLFGAAVTGWDPNSVYNFHATLDWESEADRRNYDSEEQTITEYVQSKTYNVDEAGNVAPLRIPIGQYHTYGNAQIMHPSERNRTFIGTSCTYGYDKNPDDALDEYNYNQQAQRWHFTFKLPSSAIFTPHGQPMTKANVESVMNNTSVIVAAADIKAVGDTYVLQYEHPTGNGSVTIAGTTHSLASIPYSVYAIYSAKKSAANDLSISGTH